MLRMILVAAGATGFAAGGWLCLCPADEADHPHDGSPAHEHPPAAPHECRCPDGQPALAEPLDAPLRHVAAEEAAATVLRVEGRETARRLRSAPARASPPGQFSTSLYLDHAVLLR